MTSISLRDFPLLKDIIGGALNIEQFIEIANRFLRLIHIHYIQTIIFMCCFLSLHQAQGLRSPITNAMKLEHSEHRLYVMKDGEAKK